MNGTALESGGAEVPARRQYRDPHSGETHSISATAKSPRAHVTAIRADLGEAEAYKQAIYRRGEIGLQRPMGANVPGADFITAVRNHSGNIEILVTDVKTTMTGRRSPKPKVSIPRTWKAEVKEAVSRLKLPDPHLEAEIREAHRLGRVRLRQLRVNYAADPVHGMGTITGW
jgi:hypothetical protein